MTHGVVSGHNFIHSRFTDLRDEPVNLLTPIRGFENEPLVSLEEAVNPISYLFKYIDEYVYIAKENCKNPKDGLTQDESASIYLYTMEFQPGPSFYQQLNELLRSKEPMHKLPSCKLTIWRAMHDVDLSSQYKDGNKVVWWGVSSCTLKLDVLEKGGFLGKNGMRTVCCINCQNGKEITAHSYFEEKEVILIPGSSLRVKSKSDMGNDLHIIHMEEIVPPIAFVESPISPVSVVNFSILKPPVSQTMLNKNYNSNKITPEPTTVVSHSKPNIQPTQTNVKSALHSNGYVHMEMPTQIPPVAPHTTDNPKDRVHKQKWNKVSKATILVLFLLTILPIATLIMGQLHKNDCPIQTWIPRWMTIFGAVGLATFCVLIFITLITISCCSDDDEYDDRWPGYTIGGCLLFLLILFFLAWLIAGSVWVFSINRTVQFNKTVSENYCSESLYKFTFGTLLAQYALIGLFFCVVGCGGLLVLCAG